MDEDGYPTDETLERIRAWDPWDFNGLAEFLVDLWHGPDCTNQWDSKGQLIKVEASTGGWSGNEELLGALPVMWCKLYAESWHRGGHYVFENTLKR